MFSLLYSILFLNIYGFFNSTIYKHLCAYIPLLAIINNVSTSILLHIFFWTYTFIYLRYTETHTYISGSKTVSQRLFLCKYCQIVSLKTCINIYTIQQVCVIKSKYQVFHSLVNTSFSLFFYFGLSHV